MKVHHAEDIQPTWCLKQFMDTVFKLAAHEQSEIYYTALSSKATAPRLVSTGNNQVSECCGPSLLCYGDIHSLWQFHGCHLQTRGAWKVSDLLLYQVRLTSAPRLVMVKWVNVAHLLWRPTVTHMRSVISGRHKSKPFGGPTWSTANKIPSLHACVPGSSSRCSQYTRN